MPAGTPTCYWNELIYKICTRFLAPMHNVPRPALPNFSSNHYLRSWEPVGVFVRPELYWLVDYILISLLLYNLKLSIFGIQLDQLCMQCAIGTSTCCRVH